MAKISMYSLKCLLACIVSWKKSMCKKWKQLPVPVRKAVTCLHLHKETLAAEHGKGSVRAEVEADSSSITFHTLDIWTMWPYYLFKKKNLINTKEVRLKTVFYHNFKAFFFPLCSRFQDCFESFDALCISTTLYNIISAFCLQKL